MSATKNGDGEIKGRWACEKRRRSMFSWVANDSSGSGSVVYSKSSLTLCGVITAKPLKYKLFIQLVGTLPC
jgi:hypothetical protein